MEAQDIFKQLRNGETISSNDAQSYKMREASFNTKKLLVQMNNATEPEEIRSFLVRLQKLTLMKVLPFLRRYTSIMESIPKLVKMFSSILIVFFWIWVELPLMIMYSLHQK